jgi:hypothetical protein
MNSIEIYGAQVFVPAQTLIAVFLLTISNFLQIFLLNLIFFLAHRNRYLEGMDDGQMTPCGYPNFHFGGKLLRPGNPLIVDRPTTGHRGIKI